VPARRTSLTAGSSGSKLRPGRRPAGTTLWPAPPWGIGRPFGAGGRRPRRRTARVDGQPVAPFRHIELERRIGDPARGARRGARIKEARHHAGRRVLGIEARRRHLNLSTMMYHDKRLGRAIQHQLHQRKTGLSRRTPFPIATPCPPTLPASQFCWFDAAGCRVGSVGGQMKERV